jgi:hypothetical protein
LQQDRQPERRHRQAGNGDDPHEMIQQRIASQGRHHAQRHAGHHRQHDGIQRQLERRRQPRPQVLGNWTLGEQTDAHIPGRDVGDVMGELHGKRQVEAELMAQRRHLVRRRILAGHHARRVGRDDMRDGEDGQHQPQQCRRHPQATPHHHGQQPHRPIHRPQSVAPCQAMTLPRLGAPAWPPAWPQYRRAFAPAASCDPAV